MQALIARADSFSVTCVLQLLQVEQVVIPGMRVRAA